MSFLRLAYTCEETCESFWPPNANFYAISTCDYLRLLTRPFDQGISVCTYILTGRKSSCAICVVLCNRNHFMLTPENMFISVKTVFLKTMYETFFFKLISESSFKKKGNYDHDGVKITNLNQHIFFYDLISPP